MVNRKLKSIVGNEMPDFMVDMMESEDYKNRPKKPEKVEYEAFMVTPKEKAMIEAMRKRHGSQHGQMMEDQEYES